MQHYKIKFSIFMVTFLFLLRIYFILYNVMLGIMLHLILYNFELSFINKKKINFTSKNKPILKLTRLKQKLNSYHLPYHIHHAVLVVVLVVYIFRVIRKTYRTVRLELSLVACCCRSETLSSILCVRKYNS
jgi:hypothetical protein